MTQGELEAKVRTTLQEVLAQEDTPLTVADRARIAQEVADDILGYGPIEPYLRDPDITEVMVNGSGDMYIERAGRLRKVDGQFNDETHLRRTIDKIVARVGRRIDESSPMVDARLPDGSRINAVIPPLALDGSLLTIRKFATDPYSHEDLVNFGTMTRALVDVLAGCVRARLNILVSGGTGAGKTTTLNVLSDFIPEDERIITMTDSLRTPIEGMAIVARLAARGRLRLDTIGEAAAVARAGLGEGPAVAVLDGVGVRGAAGAPAASAQPTTETLCLGCHSRISRIGRRSCSRSRVRRAQPGDLAVEPVADWSTRPCRAPRPWCSRPAMVIEQRAGLDPSSAEGGSHTLVGVALLADAADKLRVERSLSDGGVHLQFGGRSVLVHPGVRAGLGSDPFLRQVSISDGPAL